MKKNMNQLILVHRSKNDITCYKSWNIFQLFIVEGCLVFVLDGVEIHAREEVTLEIKIIYPDENIKTFVTVTYNSPDNYLCRMVENGDIRKDKVETAANALLLLKSFMLPQGIYY